MSSFKKRGAASQIVLPTGVRPSSFSSPVPLVSTGVPALDDILSGGGLSSGSILAVLPATGTSTQSSSQLGSSSTTPSAQAESNHIARVAAEPYVELVLGYHTAQGIASKHCGVLIGHDVDSFARGLMARAGDVEEKELAQDIATSPFSSASSSSSTTTTANPAGLSNSSSDKDTEPGPSEQLGTVPDDDDDDQDGTKKPSAVSAQREREMKIAWRYEKMDQFKTTVDGAAKGTDEPEAFCSAFDLSKRISPRIVDKAKAQGNLTLFDVGEVSPDAKSGNSFDQAFQRIQKAAQACLEAVQRRPSSSTAPLPPPVLRVSIRSLGSPAWKIKRGQNLETELVRFLIRIKRLLRSLAMPEAHSSGPSSTASTAATATAPAIPAIAVITLSSYVLAAPRAAASSSTVATANLAHRLSHVVDAAVSLSAFAPSPALRAAFPSYTGALKVLKTPALGTLTNPSIRASVLRGMGVGAAAKTSELGSTASSSSTTEGGAGGGENNLAFKVRRKRLVIETLHLDIEGGVSERRTKPPKNVTEPSSSKKRTTKSVTATPVLTGGSTRDSLSSQPSPMRSSSSSSSFQRRSHPTTTAVAHTPTSCSSSISTTTKPTPPKFAGLRALRERGLAVSSSSSSSHTDPNGSVEFEVEIDASSTSKPQHSHSHSHSVSSRFTSSRKEDYDF